MKQKNELILFNKEEIDGIWNLAKDLVHKACIRAGGFVDEKHIKEFCKQGTMQLWLVVTETNEVLCVCITEIRNILITVFVILKLLLVNSIKNGFTMWIKLLKWAKDQGCKKMEIFARPGYVPMFKERGYLATHVQVEKKL
jgi:hypothetical protein